MTVKERLKNGEHAVGLIINEISTPSIVHMLDACGMEILFVDCEHGYLGCPDVARLASAAKGLKIPLLVRIADDNIHNVLHYVESGCTGIVLSDTRTAEQISEVVKRLKYQPEGTRGISLQGLHNYYRPVKVREYMTAANEETMVIAHVESREGFANVEEILAVPGVDGMTIGAMDYSNDLGDPGNFNLPELRENLKKAVKAAEAAGKFCGIITSNPTMGRDCIQLGMRLWICATDASLILNGARQGVASFHEFVRTYQESQEQ